MNLDQIGRQVLGLPINMVDSARLVLTDELVRESLRRSKQAGAQPELDDSGLVSNVAGATGSNEKEA